MPGPGPGGQAGRLSYRPLAYAQGLTLADVALYTGRHHQIRLQFAGAGLPLYGDQRYNPQAKPGQQLALWAYSLTIQHPTLHKAMTFTALPQGGAWDTPGFAPAMAGAAAGFRLVYQDENLLAVDKPTAWPPPQRTRPRGRIPWKPGLLACLGLSIPSTGWM